MPNIFLNEKKSASNSEKFTFNRAKLTFWISETDKIPKNPGLKNQIPIRYRYVFGIPKFRLPIDISSMNYIHIWVTGLYREISLCSWKCNIYTSLVVVCIVPNFLTRLHIRTKYGIISSVDACSINWSVILVYQTSLYFSHLLSSRLTCKYITSVAENKQTQICALLRTCNKAQNNSYLYTCRISKF